VATVGIGAARNAGILAMQIFGASDAGMRRKMDEFKARLAEDSRSKNKNIQG
jgi:5-(carboxyamino)imidazole ribonucleotide mutase